MSSDQPMTGSASDTQPNGQRDPVLDQLRGCAVALGATVLFLPGLLLHLNATTSFVNLCAPSIWHGFQIPDLMMPLFLFCCGASVVCEEQVTPGGVPFRSILLRSGLLWAAGVVVSNLSLPFGDPFTLTGPLQRVAVTLLLVHLGVRHLPVPALPCVAVVVLLNYGMALTSHTVSPYRDTQFAADAPYGFRNNWIAAVESEVLPGDLWYGNWDPHGLLGTLAGIAFALFGATCQRLLPGQRSGWSASTFLLVLTGAVLTAGSCFLSFVQPVNHQLWTPTFVGLSTGGCLLTVGLLRLAGGVTTPVQSCLQACGRNALVLSVLGVAAAQLPLMGGAVHLAQSLPEPMQAAGLLVLVVGLICTVVGSMLWLQQKRWFVSLRDVAGVFQNRTTGGSEDVCESEAECSGGMQLADRTGEL